jgi:hypothetical protein
MRILGVDDDVESHDDALRAPLRVRPVHVANVHGFSVGLTV